MNSIPHKPCPQCKKSFKGKSNRQVYCSRDCMVLAYKELRSGPGNFAWRGGQWPYKGKSWKNISKAVIIRDKVCYICGGTDDLVAHHMIPQRYWLSLESANVMSNLVACCHDCHVKRPEHYWVELPDPFFDPALHSRLPMPRTTTALRPKPPCKVCGQPVRLHSNECCSLSCAGQLKWTNGKCEILRGYRPETIEKYTRNCDHCGKSFMDTTYMNARFCSRDCYIAYTKDNAATKAIPCSHCGKPCIKEPWRMKVSKTGKLFCSDECRDNNRRTRVTVSCPVCQKQFEVRAYRVVDGKKPLCSRQCAGRYPTFKRSQA